MSEADDIQYAANRARIEDLISRYLFALDWWDAGAYAATFAEDGILDWAGGIVQGRDAIRREAQNMRAHFARIEGAHAPLRPARLRHYITNLTVKIDGDRAAGRAYWFETNNDVPGRWPYVGGYGHFEDDFVKVSGNWLFARHKIYNEALAERVATLVNPVTW